MAPIRKIFENTQAGTIYFVRKLNSFLVPKYSVLYSLDYTYNMIIKK